MYLSVLPPDYLLIACFTLLSQYVYPVLRLTYGCLPAFQSSEPCIRGHRSTKCTHANERLMVPVRKPGRPLSTCPHPPTRGCGCGGVTAAIPRKQKCGCGSSNSADGNDVKVESPIIDAPPLSPTKSTPTSMVPGSSFRIQKPNTKSSARKQSLDPANLERIHPNQLNILPAFDAAVQSKAIAGATAIHTNGGSASTVPNTPVDLDFIQLPINTAFGTTLVYPTFPDHGSAQILTPTGSKPLTFPQASPLSNGLGSPVIDTSNAMRASNGGGSCCSGGTSGLANGHHTRTLSAQEAVISIPKQSSCCSGNKSQEPKPESVMMTMAELQASGIAMSPFQPQMGLAQPMFPTFFPQTGIFMYPPQYGSHLQPLQPAQWRQAMEGLNYGQPMPANAFMAQAPFAFANPGTPSAAPMAVTSHLCNCGSSCQCIGCAAHPYNEATQNYVRSAWNSMLEDSHANGAAKVENTTNGQDEKPNNKSAADESTSPPPPQTPSDTASGVSEEQALSASDFFFVTYPFGADPCLGETASCPCGDDCQCLGCTIHNTSANDLTE
jgi:hypothetical protein